MTITAMYILLSILGVAILAGGWIFWGSFKKKPIMDFYPNFVEYRCNICHGELDATGKGAVRVGRGVVHADCYRDILNQHYGIYKLDEGGAQAWVFARNETEAIKCGFDYEYFTADMDIECTQLVLEDLTIRSEEGKNYTFNSETLRDVLIATNSKCPFMVCGTEW